MVVFAKTNETLYNMCNIQSYKKVDDDKIEFIYNNGNKYIETYDSSDDRDTAYDNLENEFTKNIDG